MGSLASKGGDEPRVKAPAAILAISTANPPNCIHQGAKKAITKRYFVLTEEIREQNPSICSYNAASLNPRQDLGIDILPKLGMEAANKAIEEWGQSKSSITHLIVCSTAGVDMPGADSQLLNLLSLPPASTKSCSTTLAAMQADPIYLIGNVIFADGAAAMIVGAAAGRAERPIFKIVSASQELVPDSEGVLIGHYYEIGLTMQLSEKLSTLLSTHLEGYLAKAFSNVGISNGWNSIFWAPHPGGRRIPDNIEARLRLGPERLRATRHVLEEYANMSSATVLFILAEIRKKSIDEVKATTRKEMDWGTLLGFGPGITIETVILRSLSTNINVTARNGDMLVFTCVSPNVNLLEQYISWNLFS